MTTRFYSKIKTSMSVIRDITAWITVAYALVLLTIYLIYGFATQRSIWCVAICTMIYGSFIVIRCTIPAWRRMLTDHFFQNQTLKRWYDTYLQHLESSRLRPYSPNQTYRIDRYVEMSLTENLLVPFTITCSPPNRVLATAFGDYILAEMKDYPTSYGFELVLISESDMYWREEPEE